MMFGAINRLLNFVGLRNRDVLDILNDLGNFFNSTALIHGRSEATTTSTNSKRVAIASGTDEKAAKRQRIDEEGKTADGNPSSQSNKRDMSPHSFRVKEWQRNEFFDFLASADDDMEQISKIIPEKGEIEGEFNETVNTVRENEAEVQHDITLRMLQVCRCLRESDGIGEVWWRDGMKPLGAFPGTDNAIDHSFQRTFTMGGQEIHAPPVGVEVRVPWNYPGGKVTSGDVDPGRLGRDVSLVDLASSDNPVPSPADYEVKGDNPGRDDSPLNVQESEHDDNSQRMQLRSSNRIQSRQPQPLTSTRENNRKRLPNGHYQMKHEVFPPRQLVSYMLSAGLPYGFLTTGYRIDFCKLVVENNDVTLLVAGPFWTVGCLNPKIAAFLKDRENASKHKRAELATSSLYGSHYYREVGVKKFGAQKRMQFFNFDTGNVPNCSPSELDPWSTKIGEYSCNEGILRFLLAATGFMADEESRNLVPKYKVRLPEWYRKYANPKNLDHVEFSGEEGDNGPSSSDVEQGKAHIAGWKVTSFGPLSLADLQDPRRQEERIQFSEPLEGDAVPIGIGRNGQAFRKKVRGVDLVCKQVAGTGCLLEKIQDKVQNLQWEVKCYNQMCKIQGVAVPRLLYAGPMVDTRYWVCPERGHVYGLATTWEGESLDSAAGADMVKKMLHENTGSQECNIRGLLLNTLASQLNEVHACGILHKDMELRNVVCDGRKVAFVDFDAAIVLDRDYDASKEKQAEMGRLEDLTFEFFYRHGL